MLVVFKVIDRIIQIKLTQDMIEKIIQKNILKILRTTEITILTTTNFNIIKINLTIQKIELSQLYHHTANRILFKIDQEINFNKEITVDRMDIQTNTKIHKTNQIDLN